MKYLQVVVVPRASKNEIVGTLSDGSLKVRLTSPPVDGKANKTLCTLLAEKYDVKVYAVRVIRGHTSRRKVVEIDDVHY